MVVSVGVRLYVVLYRNKCADAVCTEEEEAKKEDCLLAT